ncbi:amidohydrolase [Cytobacillus kochii]|uniref:amidohydrolase n=1 Tax=Cytobacillus kochii TaxID=859143 RepID=UPI002E251C34|nr:amidohydrolase [Cytobacillus kochii]MED1605422.1 amidohydrolase [Cytobacillus kochii]
MNNYIKEAILARANEVIQLRRKFHSEPELSWEEVKTTEFIANFLEESRIPYRRMKPTGIVAEITGSKPGKRIALRADIDALPVEELNTELPYASQVKGKMHACGHDAHTAMLLVAADVLNSMKEELRGSVRLVFQPAEEAARGALAMVEQGAMIEVDHVFGIHIWSQMETNKIACTAGPQFASADIFYVAFQGQGGHGAIPHDCIDATVMASSFVMNLQSIVSRTIDPQQGAVVTVGKLESGTRFNVIAENAKLEGTVRCFDPSIRDHIEEQLSHYANQVASLYGGKATVEYIRGTQAVVNHEESAALVQEVAEACFGPDALFDEKPTMGGEDFSFYQDYAPGSFALVGSGNKDKDTEWAHHHGKFNIDEDALITGAELYAQVAWTYLLRD